MANVADLITEPGVTTPAPAAEQRETDTTHVVTPIASTRVPMLTRLGNEHLTLSM
jgi:hypothetical protein